VAGGQIYVNVQGTRVPALGFGTWQLSGRDCRRGVADALEIGYRHIDTARMYGNERQVGEGLRDAGVERADVFLVTKLWSDDLRADAVARAVPESVERLDAGYIDLLLIHWPDPSVPVADTLAAMVEEQRAGRARHLGVSNFDPAELAEAVALAPILADQVRFSPYDQRPGLLEAARQHGVMVTAYTPIEKGRVSRDRVLRDIAHRYGKSPVQVTLRWLVQQPLVSAIPKAGSAEHRRENFDIFDFELTEDEMDRITALGRGTR
jgi:diketogulonate reductase-like aldo/keto reductase